jgi:hypothetical protein
MPPSTSSNAEPGRTASYKVASRQLAADMASAGTSYGARDLGKLDPGQLVEVLTKLGALDAGQLQDSDPYLVVTARRGRFLVRPANGRLRLSEADNPARAFLELAAGDVPDYLDGVDSPAPAEDPVIGTTVVEPTNTRMGLVVGLLSASVLLVAGSAYFTFRTESSVELAEDYLPVSSAEKHASLVSQFFSGTFGSGAGDGSRAIVLSTSGTVRLIEYGPDYAVASEQQDTFKVVLRQGTIPVARTTALGPIESRDADTLVYAGDIYKRQR